MTQYEKQLEQQVEKLQKKLSSAEETLEVMVDFSANFLGDTQDEMSITNNFERYIKNKYAKELPKGVIDMWKAIIQKMGENTERDYGEKDEQF